MSLALLGRNSAKISKEGQRRLLSNQFSCIFIHGASFSLQVELQVGPTEGQRLQDVCGPRGRGRGRA